MTEAASGPATRASAAAPAWSSPEPSTDAPRDKLRENVDEIARARGLWADAWRRLARNRAALVAALILLLVALLAVLGPHWNPHPYDELDWENMAVPPQLAGSHWLGTDRLGRDLFVRTLYGVRISQPPATSAAGSTVS